LYWFHNHLALALAGAVAHIQPPMSSEMLQMWLAVAGWVVAFLLGKELATGLLQWRAQRIAAAVHRDDQQPRT
jgi:hypothetical protein